MGENRKCQFCINGQKPHVHADGSVGHGFENPEKGVAWCEPCRDAIIGTENQNLRYGKINQRICPEKADESAGVIR